VVLGRLLAALLVERGIKLAFAFGIAGVGLLGLSPCGKHELALRLLGHGGEAFEDFEYGRGEGNRVPLGVLGALARDVP
jgi:hypothetical protein